MTTEPHKLQMLHSSGDCNHRTPPELVLALQQAFPLEIDLAASAESAVIANGEDVVYLGPDHPGTAFQDALSVHWHQHWKWGFLNPPYSLSLYASGLKAGVERGDLSWLLIENWASKAHWESLKGFHTVGVFPYAPQTEWFRTYVMGHQTMGDGRPGNMVGWSGHAALDYWRIPHRVSFLTAQGEVQSNSNVNTCIVYWGPNPGFVGPWTPSGRYWTYRR
jgi:hypothetical protein